MEGFASNKGDLAHSGTTVVETGVTEVSTINKLFTKGVSTFTFSAGVESATMKCRGRKPSKSSTIGTRKSKLVDSSKSKGDALVDDHGGDKKRLVLADISNIVRSMEVAEQPRREPWVL